MSIYCALLTPQRKKSLRSTSVQVGALDPYVAHHKVFRFSVTCGIIQENLQI